MTKLLIGVASVTRGQISQSLINTFTTCKRASPLSHSSIPPGKSPALVTELIKTLMHGQVVNRVLAVIALTNTGLLWRQTCIVSYFKGVDGGGALNPPGGGTCY